MKVENIIKIENLLVQRGGVTVLDISELTCRTGKNICLDRTQRRGQVKLCF